LKWDSICLPLIAEGQVCAFYFWNDQQGLAQAVLVAKSQAVDLMEIKRWSKVEGKEQEFIVFKKKLDAR
jgi:hypothetical protein